jgi:hypothetical protein
MITLIAEVIGISPRLCAVLLKIFTVWNFAGRSKSNNEPDASHDVTQVNNVQDETSKT